MRKKKKVLRVFNGAKTTGPIVLRFEATKTPNDVYDLVIDSIDKAFGVIIASGNPELMRQGELRLEEFKARLHNAQIKVSGPVMERATFEELQNGEARS